ncbi:MAG TPA: primosomal protein N' [Pyrinomonadaceae bacterium]|nr:primosomal protein N' [Pyrinomonadaceae bacterium]
MQQPSAVSPQDSTPENPQTLEAHYAEVAVPLYVFNTFTYRLPEAMWETAAPGSRIVVPLARKFVTGYIVGLLDTLPPDTSLKEADIKEASEVLDPFPLVTTELLKLTKWVSDYYFAPWGEVIKSALPPGISPSIDVSISLSEQGRAKEAAITESDDPKLRLLQVLGKASETSLTELSSRFGKSQTARLARELEQQGLVEIRHQIGSDVVKTKYQRRVRLAKPSPEPSENSKLTELQVRVIDVLQKVDSHAFSDILAIAQVGASTVTSLQKRGLVEIFESKVRRDPLGNAPMPAVKDYVLTPAQVNVLGDIEKALEAAQYAPFLLHGVTGSGKTEVYIRAMRTALALGRSAIMLVPEIALTPVFSRRLRQHFGDKVAIFHSSLSKGERFDEWTRVRQGDARVVIGTRSAVFAPTKNLGLVIVDEEHESTYRQQDSPHYNGRDTAIVRAQNESAVVILGSATPSLESFHNAHSGKYCYLQLPDRLGDRPLASAQIIDMRGVFEQNKKPVLFSEQLLQSIKETHLRNEQSIILLNRRGYSSFVLCRSCGESIQCPNCDVTLTYHRSERVIICHYCNHREPSPNECPGCGGKYIYYVGEGTQQIEEKLAALFPTLRIARVDKDTTSRRGSFERSLLAFAKGEIDMLVGTQILAKGHDFPNVTLVGVVSVDAGLALPDFRAAERTFQLLTQVAGRAGRGDRPGTVLIQTYHPFHYALRHGSKQDYAGFYEEEIRHRQNHTYPPFVALASLLVHGADFGRVSSDSGVLRKALDAANVDRTVRILGPAQAPISRLKGEHRMQVLLKSRNRRMLREVIDTALKSAAEQGVSLRSVNVEIDPVSIM